MGNSALGQKFAAALTAVHTEYTRIELTGDILVRHAVANHKDQMPNVHVPVVANSNGDLIVQEGFGTTNIDGEWGSVDWASFEGKKICGFCTANICYRLLGSDDVDFMHNSLRDHNDGAYIRIHFCGDIDHSLLYEHVNHNQIDGMLFTAWRFLPEYKEDAPVQWDFKGSGQTLDCYALFGDTICDGRKRDPETYHDGNIGCEYDLSGSGHDLVEVPRHTMFKMDSDHRVVKAGVMSTNSKNEYLTNHHLDKFWPEYVGGTVDKYCVTYSGNCHDYLPDMDAMMDCHHKQHFGQQNVVPIFEICNDEPSFFDIAALNLNITKGYAAEIWITPPSSSRRLDAAAAMTAQEENDGLRSANPEELEEGM